MAGELASFKQVATFTQLAITDDYMLLTLECTIVVTDCHDDVKSREANWFDRNHMEAKLTTVIWTKQLYLIQEWLQRQELALMTFAKTL